jgi:hypothetical protein
MKQSEKTAWLIALIMLFVVIITAATCNSRWTKEPSVKLIDSSAIKELRKERDLLDARIDRDASLQLRLSDSLETLSERLKITKTIFVTKYKTITENKTIECDSNAYYTLEVANETINQYDSLLGLKSRELSQCYRFRKSQDSSLVFMIKFSAIAAKDKETLISELGKFRHVFLRLYRKRR